MSRLPIPRSLRARLILLTLATIFLVQAITLGTARQYQKEFTETVTVEITATTIRTLRAALAEIPAEERPDFVRKASQNQWHLWSRTLPSGTRLERRPHQRGDPQRAARPPSAAHDLRKNLRGFVDALNLKLDDEMRVGLSRGPTPRMYLSLQADEAGTLASDKQEWLVIPLDQLSPPVPIPMAAVWLSAMGLLLLLCAAFSWHITRPLTRLAKAADQLAAGQPQRVEPTGPSETRILGERFNAMLDTLAEAQAVRSTLLAGLPHDLKGPLSRMWLRIEMIDDALVKDGLRDDIQDMQRMVNQFIEFVRGSDPSSYRFTRLNLTHWLEEKVHGWQSAGSDVRLNGLDAQALMLDADPIALDRLVDNLITNALNHGQAPIEVALSAQAGKAILTISDHGAGISAGRRAEAIRPFSRLDDARTRTGSVGLGLALCDSIARAHRGTMILGEAESGGLQVTVSLPLEKSRVPD